MPVIATPIPTVSPPPPSGSPAVLCDAPGAPQFVRPFALSGDGCFFDCDNVFATIRVLPTIRRGTLVEWSLHPNFSDPGPYTFQLQFSRTGNNNADDWKAVGVTATNVYMMVDDEQRVYGKTNWAHYRVCLSTAAGNFFSRPISSLGNLSFTDRRIFTEMLKSQALQMKHMTGSGSTPGALLKRRLFGAACDCVDSLTKEVRNPTCDLCFGTGFVGGYYTPIVCTYAALHPNMSHNTLDGGKGRGTVDHGLVVPARMLAVPQLFEEDVWVDPKNDNRWFLHKIQHVVEWRGVAIAVDVQLRLAPYTDPIYDIEIPELIPEELHTV